MGYKFLDGFLQCLGVLLYILSLITMLVFPLTAGILWGWWWNCLYIITIPVAVGLINMVFG